MSGYNNDDRRSNRSNDQFVGIDDESATTDVDDGGQVADDDARTEWHGLPSDPDPKQHLGYRVDEWERFGSIDGSDQVMFLPNDEELLRQNAFVVADDDSLVTLGSEYR